MCDLALCASLIAEAQLFIVTVQPIALINLGGVAPRLTPVTRSV
jgi:hypothetical protein